MFMDILAMLILLKKLQKKIDEFKNFGFSSQTTADQIGINAKMSEFNAALGLLQLKQIDRDIEKRKSIDKKYRKLLKDIPGIRCHIQSRTGRSNYSYFPIFIDSTYHMTRNQLYEKLKDNGIFARKYWYPLITDFLVYQQNSKHKEKILINAEKIANTTLCLPIYSELKHESIELISNLIKSN